MVEGSDKKVDNAQKNDSVAVEIDSRTNWSKSKPDRLGYVKDMFIRAVEDAGLMAYGVVCVHIRVLNEELTELEMPEGGNWVDPVFMHSQPSGALSRLFDKNHPDFLPPEPIFPGVGLGGIFWAEARITVEGRAREYSDEEGFHGNVLQRNDRLDRLRWREIAALAADPDQPPSPRLQLLAEAGIGLAGAVRFDCQGREGVVIFGARKSVDRNKLESESNTNFICSATNMIAALIPYQENYVRVFSERKSERDAALKRARLLIAAVQAFSKLPQSQGPKTEKYETSKPDENSRPNEKTDWASDLKPKLDPFKDRASAWAIKFRGAGVHPPPPLPWNQVIWAFFGSFCTCLLWSLLNEGLGRMTDGRQALTRGSFGSLVAAQYLLMAAPASQPRNAFLSEVVCGVLALSINYIPGFPVWVRTAVTPALVIAAMGKLGITHPTTGGDALLYAHNGGDWILFGCILFNYAFAILMATIINNMSSRRQYPIYWGFMCRNIGQMKKE